MNSKARAQLGDIMTEALDGELGAVIADMVAEAPDAPPAVQRLFGVGAIEHKPGGTDADAPGDTGRHVAGLRGGYSAQTPGRRPPDGAQYIPPAAAVVIRR